MNRGLRTSVAVAAALLALVAAAAGPAPAAASRIPERPKLPVLVDLRGPGARSAAEAAALPGLLGALPTSAETGAYAAGRVAVGVIFVESDGSIDHNSENWSRRDPAYPGDRRANVLARIHAALDWWNARSPDGSLDVFVPAAGEPGAPRTVTTGYEPIKRPIGFSPAKPATSDAVWRWQVMKKLGYGHHDGHDTPPPERAYAAWLRRANHADWAFVVYVVDSLADRDGAFADYAIAYTRDLFGPYSVLTYDDGAYGFGDFDAVLAHEMGHQFGALDEYRPPYPGYPSTGGLTSGYLGVRNRNAVVGGTTHYSCIMRGSNPSITAYRHGALCPSTRGQVGLRDSDGDTHPDVVDTRPLFTDGPQAAGAGGGVTVAGTVREKAFPRGHISGHVYFHHDLSIFTPQAARYRIDGGDWQPLTATDGAFDEPLEGWSLTTPALTAGHHVLEVQATTGSTAGFTRDLWVGPTSVTLHLAADQALTAHTTAVAFGHAVRLYVHAGSGGFAVPYLRGVTVLRIAGAGGAGSTAAAIDRGGRWSGTFKPTHNATYEARFAGDGQFLGPVSSEAVTVGVCSALTVRKVGGPLALGRRLRIAGIVRPEAPGASVTLEESRDGGSTWVPVTGTHVTAASSFALGYPMSHRGAVRLRLRVAATATNLEGAARLPVFRVH